MHAGQPAIGAGHAHDLKQLGIVDHHHAGHHHEHFETRYAVVLKQQFHIDQGLVVEIRNDHVGADIDAGLGGAALPIIETGDDAVALGLLREIHQRRGAAEGRRRGAGLEGIDGDGGADLGFQMGVDVDTAGQHQQARRVMHLDVIADLDIEPDGVDAAALDQNVCLIVIGRGDDPAALDQLGCHG